MNVLKIALRNLLRYKRRSLLTSALIAMGVTLMIVSGGIGNAFKSEVIGIITGSVLGDLQIHRTGYVGSIDNIPLDMNIPPQALPKIEAALKADPDVASYSLRIRFGGMISNFTQTTNMRFNAVLPEEESKTCPGLPGRIKDGEKSPSAFVKPGFIVIPENVASGMQLKPGSDVVLIATNKDGSVNGLNLRISGISENILGPGGKDGYIHMEDAKTLLRMEENEVTEIAVKLKNFYKLETASSSLKNDLTQMKSQKSGKPVLEVHTWEELSPFASIAHIITLLLLMVRIVLVFIVAVSILNVMMMSVYERIGEIGTIASIGTLPSGILALFLSEGLILGFLSALAGALVGVSAILIMAVKKLPFTFGRMDLLLVPAIPTFEILLAFGVVVVVSAVASLEPALKASRMEPVDALRHV